MLLSLGDKLGTYEILAPIGLGSTAEVYRAHDPHLNRDIAIRISKSPFTERFIRDARAIAGLSHRNICRLYDIGPDYLVMEYVAGNELRGPLSFDDAKGVIVQLIDGIEAAHQKNIIHGDLKPTNVKITADGVVKILDFGMAHATSLSSNGVSAEGPPALITVTKRAEVSPTAAAYLAPQQARDLPADKRSDIWAFGALVYELLTGNRLFAGESSEEILAAIRKKTPDISAAPERSHRLLRWCFEQDRKRRPVSISEARELLKEEAVPLPPTPKGAFTTKNILAGALALIVVGLALAFWSGSSSVPQPVTRLTIPLPPGQEIVDVPAVSPDGRTVAYVKQQGVDPPQLYLQDVRSTDARPVPGSIGAQQPFFSPDGQWIAFFSQGQLLKTQVGGSGSPVRLAEAPHPYGGTWSEDNTIIYASSLSSGLWRIPAAGGTPEALTMPDGAALGYGNLFPQTLPGGSSVLFTIWGRTPANAVFTLASRRPAMVLPGTMVTSTFVRTRGSEGYLLLPDDTAGLKAAPLDVAHPGKTGGAYSVLNKVYSEETDLRAWLAASNSGTVVSAPGSSMTRSVVWVDREGKWESLGKGEDAYAQVSLSPDGTKAAIRHGFDLWIHDLLRGTRSRLTSGDAMNIHPVWNSDGTRVIFASNRAGDWDLFSQIADASQPAQEILKRPDDQFPLSIAGDGTLLFAEIHATMGYDLWTLSPDGTVQPLRATSANEKDGQFAPSTGSPRWVAYSSDESGRNEIYVESYPDEAKRTQVSNEGGIQPRWSRDGKELFFVTADAVVGVDFKEGSVGTVHKLFDRGNLLVHGYGYDVAPNGKFLAIQRDAASVPRQLNVILNWTEELERLATGGK